MRSIKRFEYVAYFMLTVGLIGKDGRTTALEMALKDSHPDREIVCLSAGKGDCTSEILKRAAEVKPAFVVVGPEEPLEAGVVDSLRDTLGIPCVGPTKSLARIESSKAFARQLLAKYGIPGNPLFRVFENLAGIEQFLEGLDGFVIKPDGLTGGKGVKVSDAHLYSVDDAVEYCRELFTYGHEKVVVEEKLDGEEFSLQSFCDGVHVIDMPPVQDHKRVWNGDTGPNTGGMGSYSCEDHSLPFLKPEHLRQASAINSAVSEALFSETGERYRGILYGGFMATRDGIRLIEYNARFGDPEALNVLSLLTTDFGAICQAIIKGDLSGSMVNFAKRATVCKYIVPQGYPDAPVTGMHIDLSGVPPQSDKLKWFLAAVNEHDGAYYLTGSRAMAFVGIGQTVQEAEMIAEQAASAVRGPVEHRSDIGSSELLQKRVDHMNELTLHRLV